MKTNDAMKQDLRKFKASIAKWEREGLRAQESGDADLAAHNALVNFFMLASCFMFGAVRATSVRVGACLGADLGGREQFASSFSPFAVGRSPELPRRIWWVGRANLTDDPNCRSSTCRAIREKLTANSQVSNRSDTHALPARPA